MTLNTTRVRERLAERDGGWFCHYCQRPLESEPHRAAGPRPPFEAVIDHRTPASRGGPDALWNLVLACRSCNGRKGTRPYLEVIWEGMGLGLLRHRVAS